jgi:hypothetical protein
MPESLPAPLLGAFGASLLAACSLPSATLQLDSNDPAQPSPAAKAPPPARERKPGLDRRRPEVVHAELVTGDHLRLHFSEPLATLDGVDPNDFRLSLGMAKSYKFYAYAYYFDLGDTVEGDHGLLRLSAIAGQGDTLDLQLEPAFDLAYCHELMAELVAMQSEPDVKAEGGLFLHYSPGEQPITDEAGNGLAAIGPDWVQQARRGGEDAYEMYFEGPQARKALRGLIPIECGPVTSP